MIDCLAPHERKRRTEALRLFRLYMVALDAYREATGEDRPILQGVLAEALAAYERHGVELDCDYSDDPWICGISGLPLVVGDEYVVDHALSHIRYLRVACGLPLRKDEPPAPEITLRDGDDLPTIAELFACP